MVWRDYSVLRELYRVGLKVRGVVKRVYYNVLRQRLRYRVRPFLSKDIQGIRNDSRGFNNLSYTIYLR